MTEQIITIKYENYKVGLKGNYRVENYNIWNLEISLHRIERNHLKDNLEESKPGRPYPALHIAGDLELARRL